VFHQHRRHTVLKVVVVEVAEVVKTGHRQGAQHRQAGRELALPTFFDVF